MLVNELKQDYSYNNTFRGSACVNTAGETGEQMTRSPPNGEMMRPKNVQSNVNMLRSRGQ